MGGGHKEEKDYGVFLPSGGGKLRCRDVLGLGSGRGSCLNPEGRRKSGVEEKVKQQRKWMALSAGLQRAEWNASCISL